MNNLKLATVHTDEAWIPNLGRGGHGVGLLHAGHRKQLSSDYCETTIDRMGILAAIKGFKP